LVAVAAGVARLPEAAASVTAAGEGERLVTDAALILAERFTSPRYGKATEETDWETPILDTPVDRLDQGMAVVFTASDGYLAIRMVTPREAAAAVVPGIAADVERRTLDRCADELRETMDAAARPDYDGAAVWLLPDPLFALIRTWQSSSGRAPADGSPMAAATRRYFTDRGLPGGEPVEERAVRLVAEARELLAAVEAGDLDRARAEAGDVGNMLGYVAEGLETTVEAAMEAKRRADAGRGPGRSVVEERTILDNAPADDERKVSPK
jgi:hypothetical protein